MQASTSIMKTLVTLLLVASMVATSHGANRFLYCPLQLRSDGGNQCDTCCRAWWDSVEGHNITQWKTVPAECEEFMKNYFLGGEFENDSKAVTEAACNYARSLDVTTEDIWIFDVDHTSLSNVPYFEEHGWGTEEFNETAFDEWLKKGEAPALPETLNLYKQLLDLGIKIVFLTERELAYRDITIANLNHKGYYSFFRIIVRGLEDAEEETPSGEFKRVERERLEEQGYKIIGTIGDQFSDFLGGHVGRSFKLPNSVYYIA